MKRLFAASCLMICLLAFLAIPAFATKPGNDVNPNGFPSGDHYNLNVIGKKADFTCPEQAYDDLGNPVYGNVIFVPESGSDIRILMQSGSGKRAIGITTFAVTDPCTASIDGDPAVLQLPPNDKGYRVYARALAKPTDNPSMTITPDLVSAVDEFGNDLIFLGLVTSNGFTTPYATFTRTAGKSTAINITGLFEWSGDVCYFSTAYCDPVTGCTTKALCCTDADANGIYEGCVVKEGDLCPEGTLDITAYCRTYVDEWVFNIADFVTYLWGLENNGLKLLQVRFYPN